MNFPEFIHINKFLFCLHLPGCKVLLRHLLWMKLQCPATFTTNCWGMKLRMWSSSASSQSASLPRVCLTSTTHRLVSENKIHRYICTHDQGNFTFGLLITQLRHRRLGFGSLGAHLSTCPCLSAYILIEDTLCFIVM